MRSLLILGMAHHVPGTVEGAEGMVRRQTQSGTVLVLVSLRIAGRQVTTNTHTGTQPYAHI